MKKNNLNLYNEKESIPGIYAQEILDIENTLHAINTIDKEIFRSIIKNKYDILTDLAFQKTKNKLK